MMSASTITSPRDPGTEMLPVEPPRIRTSLVDASLRWPLIALFSSAAGWLLFGTVLGLISAIKLHKGDILADWPWLTLGRIRPASVNAVLYGFASQSGMGILLWLFCRLGNVRFVYQVPVIIAAKLWNLGVLAGVLGIMAGGSTGFEWLEMPRYAAIMLFTAYAVFGLCALGTFQMRQTRELYPSQWFLLAALFWFPWAYSATYYLLVLDPVRGVFQSVVAAWFAGNFLNLWLAPLALAALYYFLPKLTGKPLYSRSLAAFSFWTLLFFGSWAGMAALQGAPVPRWVPNVGTAAMLCLLVPLLGNALNWYYTSSYRDLFKKMPEARFLLLGAVLYLLSGLVDLTLASPGIAVKSSLTLVGMGAKALVIHGFVSCVLLGSIYYILPRVLQVAWPAEGWIKTHFGLQAAGALLIFIGLTVGGMIQGAKLADPAVPFISIARGTAPFVGISTLGVLLLLMGQLVFVANLFRMLRTFVDPFYRSVCAEFCGRVSVTKSRVKP
jgi:cytochrome c oxidase cbb3-type subunit I